MMLSKRTRSQTSGLCEANRKICRRTVPHADFHWLTGAYLKPLLITPKTPGPRPPPVNVIRPVVPPAGTTMEPLWIADLTYTGLPRSQLLAAPVALCRDHGALGHHQARGKCCEQPTYALNCRKSILARSHFPKPSAPAISTCSGCRCTNVLN